MQSSLLPSSFISLNLSFQDIEEIAAVIADQLDEGQRLLMSATTHLISDTNTIQGPRKLRTRPPSLVGSDIVRKHGDEYRLRREIEAMQFVRSRTSIPVPRVIEERLDPAADAYANYFCMDRMPGTELGTAWPLLSEQARMNATGDLKSHFEQLRQIRPESSEFIGSCSRGPAYDHRIDNQRTCGPFESVRQFHDFLVKPITRCPRPEFAVKYRKLLSDDIVVYFTHADISPENVLVDPDTGHVTAILDWEMAGFWPEWWEYRKALFGNRCERWWIAVMDQVMHPYPIQTEADMDIEWF